MKADAVRIPVERIEKAIYLIRGEKVMLDQDLAELYGVEKLCTKSENPTHGSGWMVQVPSTRERSQELGNPPHGSGGIVQVPTTLPETSAKYQQKHMNRTDLNNPCTAVQGIHRSRSYVCCRKHLNHPPTAVGGIFAFCAKLC